jgi:hypothetical protein
MNGVGTQVAVSGRILADFVGWLSEAGIISHTLLFVAPLNFGLTPMINVK